MPKVLAHIAVCLLMSLILAGCGESYDTPIPIKEVQVEASFLAEGYDVYKYVAIKRPMDAAPDKINSLLDYYEELYADSGKVKVMVFPDAASAIQAISDRVLAELDMENGEVIRRVVNTR